MDQIWPELLAYNFVLIGLDVIFAMAIGSRRSVIATACAIASAVIVAGRLPPSWDVSPLNPCICFALAGSCMRPYYCYSPPAPLGGLPPAAGPLLLPSPA